MNRALALLVLLVAGCATVRPITYPSPCSDRGKPIRCQIMGYEVWGTPAQIQAQAKKCRQSAHVSIDPHRDYGVVRCYTPDFLVREAPAVVVVEQPIPDVKPDMEVSLQEAEAPPKEAVAPVEFPPQPELRDQPRPAKPKARRSRGRRKINPTDD